MKRYENLHNAVALLVKTGEQFLLVYRNMLKEIRDERLKLEVRIEETKKRVREHQIAYEEQMYKMKKNLPKF